MVAIRPARADEHPTVLAILDAAALATDADRIETAIETDDVLVATAGDGERVLGALVLDGHEVVDVAVRPGRRGRGIGGALVETAAARSGRLAATFEADLRPFYESLGFAVEPVAPDDPDADRLRGTVED